MMNRVVLTRDFELAMRIKSLYSTLDNYRRTSMALHNRLTPATYVLGKNFSELVEGISKQEGAGKLTERWARKFGEMAQQYDLFSTEENS